MAENMFDAEQRKYLGSIVGLGDPTQTNPFSVDESNVDESGHPVEEKDIVDLPFRFTQWELNKGGKAATGQASRTAVPRSPATSGSLASELQGITSSLNTMSYDGADLKYGMPIKNWELPSNMILGDRNPLGAARAFADKYKTPEERAAFGPMTTIQGYDTDALMKASGWNGNLEDQYGGAENKSTQTFFQNLGLLPASFDPNMGSKDTMRNLSSQDFTYNQQPIQYDEPQMIWIGDGEGGGGQWVDQNSIGQGEGQSGAPLPTGGRMAMSDEEWDQQFKFGQPGEAGTVGQTGFGKFENQVQETIARELHNGSGISQVAHKYGLQATIAVMAAMSAGAASVAMAPAAGAAGGAAGGGAGGAAGGGAAAATEASIAAGVAAGADVGMAPAASGIAGAMGMSAGTGASAVNSIATMIAKYGVTAAARMAGVPVENPLFQMAMAAAGGAYSGATGGATGGVSADSMKAEQLQAASNMNMSPEAYAHLVLQSPSIDDYVFKQMTTPAEGILSNTTNAGTIAVSPQVFSSGASGLANPSSQIDYKGMGRQAGEFGLKAGMQEAQATANQEITDNQMAAEQAQYEQELQQYENERQALVNRQTGVRNQINSLISTNPAYQNKPKYDGVQGELWR